MDAQAAEHLAGIVALAQATFRDVVYATDSTPKRAILRLEAVYDQHRILVTELLSGGKRKYQYHALRGDWVEAGSDNSPDPRVLRLKYGQIGAEHAGEYVPHLHLENKTRLSLTEDAPFAFFVDWLKANI